MSSRRTHSRTIHRKRYNHKKLSMLFLLTIILVFIACGVSGSLISSAQSNRTEDPVEFKYYKSIVIQDGDTLWDIAKNYKTEDTESIEDYVQELQAMNNLSSDDIHYGQRLVVVYNDTEFH